MIEKRKPLSKKIRYEVLKRDKFTCQYCGRKAPDVILHIDHIKPIAKGGKNDIMNLITSCKDCNLGKGARELSDDSIVRKQQIQIQELAEKNEQLEMMLKWREELQKFSEKEIDAINEHISSFSNWELNDVGKKQIKKLLKEFSIQLILDAVDIAFDKYYDGTERGWKLAFSKIGGICNNKNRKDGNHLYYFNYLKKACTEKYRYFSIDTIKHYAWDLLKDDDDFELAKSYLRSCRYFDEFMDSIEGELGNNGDIS